MHEAVSAVINNDAIVYSFFQIIFLTIVFSTTKHLFSMQYIYVHKYNTNQINSIIKEFNNYYNKALYNTVYYIT